MGLSSASFHSGRATNESSRCGGREWEWGKGEEEGGVSGTPNGINVRLVGGKALYVDDFFLASEISNLAMYRGVPIHTFDPNIREDRAGA